VKDWSFNAIGEMSRMLKCLTCACILLLFSGSVAAESTLEAIKERGVLRHIAVPYANFNTGEGSGFSIELVKLFADYLGVGYATVTASWDNVISYLTGLEFQVSGNEVVITGKTEVKGDLICTGLTVLPWRKKLVLFSDPVFPTQVWLVTPASSPLNPIVPTKNEDKDVEQVKKLIGGLEILGKKNTCLDPYLYGLDKFRAKIRFFDGALNDLAGAVFNGLGDATILDVPDALIALKKWPGKVKVIGPVSKRQVMACAFRKDSQDLLTEFNKFLAKIKSDGTYIGLVKKYYPLAPHFFPDFFVKVKK